MKEKKIDHVKEKIEKIGKLPTFPQVAFEVKKLMKDPKVAMEKIGKIIENDPSLTVTLLRMANSAFYGLLVEVKTVQHALSVMGLKALNNLVTSICMFKTFDTIKNHKEFDKKAFFKHSTGCGAIATMIAKKLGFDEDGEYFIAGLTHDLGKIVLDFYFHSEFMQALDLAVKEDITLSQAEEKIIGANHSQIGSWLAEKWKLPPTLIESIALHHDPSKAKLDRSLVSIIHLANTLCKTRNIGFGGDFKYVSLVDDAAWKILAQEKPQLEELDIERLVLELDDEIEKSQDLISATKVLS